MTLDSHSFFTHCFSLGSARAALSAFLFALLALSVPVSAAEADNAVDAAPSTRVDTGLTREMETIKKDLLDLRRDLVVLEEDLLFPASSQVAVFVGLDAGTFFQLDAVTLKINGKEVTHHLYTEKGRDYRRASSVTFDKTFEPAFVELKVTDSEEKYQPDFTAAAGSSSGR